MEISRGHENWTNGFLVVRTDSLPIEEAKKDSNLHANFKLSNSGETFWLVDTETNGYSILDKVKFGLAKPRHSFGLTDSGKWEMQTPTPGK